MLVEKNIDLHNSQVSWLSLEQEIAVELEDSFYWLLKKLDIHRFSFEHDPDNNSTKTLFVWLPLNEWLVRDPEILVKSLISLAKPFDLTLPACKWIHVKDEDWSLSWKKSWKPDPVGKSILILPAWLDIPKNFSGTSSHAGKIKIDLPTGSGSQLFFQLKLHSSSFT